MKLLLDECLPVDFQRNAEPGDCAGSWGRYLGNADGVAGSGVPASIYYLDSSDPVRGFVVDIVCIVVWSYWNPIFDDVTLTERFRSSVLGKRERPRPFSWLVHVVLAEAITSAADR